MSELTLTSEITVEPIQQVGSDAMIAAAARVSTRGVAGLNIAAMTPADAEADAGLIRYLMKHRHGCYDDETDVLTASGWKRWPEVDGTEEFLTLNLNTDEIEYHHAERVVHKPWSGPMVRLRMAQVDALVTPDHRMAAAPRTHSGWEYGLYPAKDFLARCHRLRMGGGEWGGLLHAPEEAELAGFIAADAHVSDSIEFNLRRPRKVEWLRARATVTAANGRYRLQSPSDRLRRWARATYVGDDRCLPRELLRDGDRETMLALLDGYLTGDGNVSATGKITCTTVSRRMVDDLQEAAVKAGMAATETAPETKRAGSFGDRPLYRLTFYRGRNAEPRIGWTEADRREQVSIVDYQGGVHCVTVPNGTLYVRRGGKPMWCGNTPFEHGLLTVRVHAPIKVWREWHRHRTGWNFNEESGRYKQLDPVFYLPPRDRPMIRPEGFKSARPAFDVATDEEYSAIVESLTRGYQFAYGAYEDMLAVQADRGLARDVLGVGIYSACYCTANPRSIMAFLELRTDHPEAKRPSKPLYEIRVAADKLEAIFAAHWPATYAAWVACGRAAP